MVNVEPCPGPALLAVTSPPCMSTIRLTIERPKPVELSPAVGLADNRWKRPNSRPRSSGERPAPSSTTRMRSCCLPGRPAPKSCRRRAVFDGVADEVVDRLADPVRVAGCGQVGRGRNRNRLLLVDGKRLIGIGHFADQCGDIDRLAADGDVEGVRHRIRDQVIDHRGQTLGRVANMVDLGVDVVAGGGGGDQFGQHFGAAEDDAQRILQVVGDGAENFVLEAVGALQPQPLRRQPAIGLHQRAGALGDAVLELGIGLLELLVKDDVVERDRKPAAEDLDQRAVGLRQWPLGLEQHHDLAPVPVRM